MIQGIFDHIVIYKIPINKIYHVILPALALYSTPKLLSQGADTCANAGASSHHVSHA